MSEITMNLTLTFKIPDDGINVNGLLLGLKNVSSQIMLAITKTLFHAIEEKAIENLKTESKNKVIRYGRQRARTLKTSFGDFKYSLAQVKKLDTGQILVPLRKILKIPKYRRYQNESMKDAVGLSVHLSYSRSDREVKRIRGSGASKWTVCRRLHEFSQSQCHFGDLKKIPYSFLMVDGTGIHLQGPGGIDLGQSRMRWALASTSVNQPFDIVGIWIGKSWEQISEDLNKRLNYKNIEILISDGGPGIEENLLTEGMRHQRCIFHGKRDLPFILYQDGIKRNEQKEFTDFLNKIPAMAFSKSSLEKLSEKDKDQVARLCKRTENDFKELIRMLNPKKYPKARVYIQNLSKHVTVFFEWWLERNESIPFTSNIIENRFSQVKNRIKKIGKRWSDTGLEKWLMVAIQKIFTPENWDQLWKRFLDINRPLELVNVTVSYRWC